MRCGKRESIGDAWHNQAMSAAVMAPEPYLPNLSWPRCSPPMENALHARPKPRLTRQTIDKCDCRGLKMGVSDRVVSDVPGARLTLLLYAIESARRAGRKRLAARQRDYLVWVPSRVRRPSSTAKPWREWRRCTHTSDQICFCQTSGRPVLSVGFIPIFRAIIATPSCTSSYISIWTLEPGSTPVHRPRMAVQNPLSLGARRVAGKSLLAESIPSRWHTVER